MLGRTYDRENCSAARALEVVGERWSLLILRDAIFRGITRFTAFQDSLGIAINVLTNRLEGFVTAGIMQTILVFDRPGQHEYHLTPAGQDVATTLIALTQWGHRWRAAGGPPISYVHRHATSSGKQHPYDGIVFGRTAMRRMRSHASSRRH